MTFNIGNVPEMTLSDMAIRLIREIYLRFLLDYNFFVLEGHRDHSVVIFPPTPLLTIIPSDDGPTKHNTKGISFGST